MNIDRIIIENISQVVVGDIVVVDTRTLSTQYAKVSRVLKTKFELEYDSGEKVEYSTDISHGHIYRKGETKGGFNASVTRMFPLTDEVNRWCAHESRKLTAKKLKDDLVKLLESSRSSEVGTDESCDLAQEIAYRANDLSDLEARIYFDERRNVSTEKDEK